MHGFGALENKGSEPQLGERDAGAGAAGGLWEVEVEVGVPRARAGAVAVTFCWAMCSVAGSRG